MPPARRPAAPLRALRILALIALVAVPGGCGGPGRGPSPTPEGQVGPGEPDPSGIPRPPSGGGVR